jgi:hypothetical protein
MRLPGTAEWANENVAAQIVFERSFAAAAPRLMDSMSFAYQLSEEARLAMPRVSEAVFALGRAAELAFATEDIRLGLRICADLAAVEKTRPNTPMQLAFYAAVASIAATVQLEIDPEGVSLIRLNEQDRSLRYRWPQDDSPLMVTMMRRFFPAAFASLPWVKISPLLFNPQTIKPQAMAAFAASLEFRALMAVPNEGQQSSVERLRAIEMLEENYAARLSLMRNDVHHWDLMQPTGALLDWPLLCIWVGILRFDPAMAEIGSRPRNEAGAFIRWLAMELRSPSRFSTTR